MPVPKESDALAGKGIATSHPRPLIPRAEEEVLKTFQ